MTKTHIGILIGALLIALPMTAPAHSGNQTQVAVIGCNENGGAVTVVAVSESPGTPVITVGADCATSLATLANSGMKVANVVQTSTGWVYTLSGSHGND